MNQQGNGLGRALYFNVRERARSRGVGALYLLTTTAADYFERLGFIRESRESAPVALRASAEFRGACPASATLLVCLMA